MSKRVEVWLKQPNKRIDSFYDYAVPPELNHKVAPGMRVVVPFNSDNRFLEGFITAVKNNSDFEEKLKSIVTVIDAQPVLTIPQIRLCDWIRRYYCAMFYEALAPFTAPVRVTRKRSPKDDPDSIPQYTAYAAKSKAVKKSKQNTPPFKSLNDEAAKLILSYCRDVDRDAAISENAFGENKVNYEKPAFFSVKDAALRFECYCALAAMEASAGRQTVILYPEANVLGLREKEFTAYFGDAGVLCYGGQKPSVRYRVWDSVRTGMTKVVLGSRSALFLPFKHIGMIIIDSPWDDSYTSVAIPRYDTYRTAKAYSHLTGASMIAGGSFVSVSLTAEIRASMMRLYSLPNERSISPEIVDMKQELRHGNTGFISALLDHAIADALAKKEKVLLLLGSRGQAGAIFCRDCGQTIKCPTCQVALHLREQNRLRCDYCGYTQSLSKTCPHCGSKRFRQVGIGTDQGQKLLTKRYPKARFLKIDGDTLTSPEDYAATQAVISEGEWDIIIGTRMLLKGFEYGSVAVTGALLMDGLLNGSDYTAAEEAYLVYRQFFALSHHIAIGQTYQPDHSVVTALEEDDPTLFMNEELDYRKRFGYPPAGHMVVFTVSHLSANQAATDADILYKDLSGVMERVYSDDRSFRLYPPTFADIQPISGRVQYNLLLKLKVLEPFHQGIWTHIQARGIEKLESKVAIQVDPKASI